MLNLVPVWVAFSTVFWGAEKEWFLISKPCAQTLVKTLPSAYGAGKTTYSWSKTIIWPIDLRVMAWSQQKHRINLHLFADHANHIRFPHDCIRAHDL